MKGGEAVNNQTIENLSTLKLQAMIREYRRQLELSAMNELPFDERLALMVDAECISRFNNRLKRLIKAANLRDPAACLEDLDYDAKRKLDKVIIARLSDCEWITSGKNLIITGATGTGKTYLSCAFGNAACRLGKKVRAYRTNRLLTDLEIGRGDGSYNKILADLKKPELLILDDFGMAPIPANACRDLMEVVDDRYEHKSILITAQLPVASWHPLFEDATIADAVLDRIVNNSYRIQLSGPTKRQQTTQDDITATTE